MQTIITSTANRSERDKEAKRLSELTGREVDWRPRECPCDEWKCCSKCDGTGGFFEAFFLSCNHRVFESDDLDCVENFCAEREAVGRELEREVA